LAAGQTAAKSVTTLAGLVQQAITDDDTYLALAAPTADEQLAQIRRLTRQMLAVARYLSAVVPQSDASTLTDVSDVVNP
jgi:gamma-glutamyl phosphate reductase